MGSAKYSEFADSQIHVEAHYKSGLFQQPQDIAFSISTDGAQLTMKKQSNTWILILIILDLPGDLRYKGDFVIVNFATPGPNSPGDIESFLYPLLEEAALGTEGIWIWSAIKSDNILTRWYITLISKVAGRYTTLHKLFSRCSCGVICASFIACSSL